MRSGPAKGTAPACGGDSPRARGLSLRRRRCPLRLALGLVVALAAAPAAAATPGAFPGPREYADDWRGWPVAPDDSQHPVRGSFLDPRPDGFHIGIDINVRDDRPAEGAPPRRSHRVHALEGGIVQMPANTASVGCANRQVDVGHFSYWHVDPIGVVLPGQFVAPGQHIGWTCTDMWHVHLSEWALLDGERVWVNPLDPRGKLHPFADRRAPRIGPIGFFTPAPTRWNVGAANAIDVPQAGTRLAPLRLRGLVDVRAAIADPQSEPGWFGELPALDAPHHPYRVRLEITRLADGRRVLARDVVRAEALSLDGKALPPFARPTRFTTHYAPGTRQNLAALHCLRGVAGRPCAGSYSLRLFARPGGTYWNTRLARNGRYRLVVHAWDTRGNRATRAVTIAIRN